MPVPDGFVPLPARGNFESTIGPFYLRDEADTRVFGFRTGTQHCHPGGVVHGGLLMTVMDDILSLTILHAFDRQTPIATVSLNCDFLTAVQPGDWIEGSGEIIRKTRSLVFVRGRLATGGRTVLTASGVWAILGRAGRAARDRRRGAQIPRPGPRRD